MIDLLFHVLLGTPRGLNLRNLVWHGFASLKEIPAEVTAAVIVLILTISPAVVEATFGSATPVRSKPLSDLKQVEPLADAIADADVVVDGRLLKMVDTCDQLPSGKADLIRLAIDRYETLNFRACLFILLPEFELLMRYLSLFSSNWIRIRDISCFECGISFPGT